MRDGVHNITTGRLGWIKYQVIIVGGNCSVTVLDHEGNELYWTIASGIVRVITVFDFDGDAQNEVII